MKTRGIQDFYLPEYLARHVKYFLFCVVFTPIWGVIIKAELSAFFLTATFLMMFIIMEILAPVSRWMFDNKTHYTRKGITQREITLSYLARLLFFYLITLIVVAVVFALVISGIHIVRGWELPDLPLIFKPSVEVFKTAMVALFFTTPLFFFIPWQQSMKREFELKEQNLIFQNETLKSQVNPHFLFNCLNTLSSLVNTQSDTAGHFIIKLSSIYRYILDNGSKVKVPLKDELQFIRDYFYLYQIRNEGKILLRIDIGDDEEYEILPVSLQTLIENAIKHNMATFEKPLRIFIYAEGEYIVVKNNVQRMATQVVSTKIGLKNLNERFTLMTGKGIIVEKTGEEFLVKAPLLT